MLVRTSFFGLSTVDEDCTGSRCEYIKTVPRNFKEKQ